jgi:hypothetical protein
LVAYYNVRNQYIYEWCVCFVLPNAERGWYCRPLELKFVMIWINLVASHMIWRMWLSNGRRIRDTN